MPSRTRAVSFDKLSPLALAVGLAFAGCAQAQDSKPYYVGVTQAFTHDSNVFRSTDGLAVSDTISSTGLLGGLNVELGRQRVYADLSANSNRFRRLDQLNNTSYTLSSGINWQTVEHLSGTVSVLGRQNLGQFSIPGSPQVKNVETLRQAVANVRYGFASHLGIEGGVEHRTLKYTYTTERNLTERVGNLGLRWGTPGSLLTLGVGGRATKGDAPLYKALLDPSLPFLGFGPVTPDTYNRKDLDFTATWTPSALSTVTARISATREDHSADSRPDFHGVTGAVTWDYKPTGRLALKGSLTRDTASQTVFTTSLLSNFLPVQSNTSQLNTTLGLDAAYELTAKIGLTANLAYGSNVGTYDVTDRTVGNSSTKLGLGANYQITRTIALGCNASRESRSNYHDNTVGCSAQFVLR